MKKSHTSCTGRLISALTAVWIIEGLQGIGEPIHSTDLNGEGGTGRTDSSEGPRDGTPRSADPTNTRS
jgi:hypothetical protein